MSAYNKLYLPKMQLYISNAQLVPKALNVVVCKSEKHMQAFCRKHAISCQTEDAVAGVIIKHRPNMYVMFVMANDSLTTAPSFGKFRQVNISFEGVAKQDASNWFFAFNRRLYSFDKYKGLGTPKKSLLHISLYHTCAQEWVTENGFINHVRDIENEPSNVLYPDTFCQLAKKLLAPYKKTTKVRVLNHDDIIRERLMLIDAVGKGSNNSPRLLIIEYDGKKQNEDAAAIALVGKGVMFDTGGVNLKPTQGIQHMHHDKSGASVCLGAILYFAEIKAPLKLIALLPLVDNSISATATKPHDVVRSYSGQHVEINNTDAEGRLIMADALAYVRNFKIVKWVLDIATLTGGMQKLYPHLASGYFTHNRGLLEPLNALGERVGEKVWPIPYWDDGKRELHSQIANISNVSSTQPHDTYYACMFLSEFVPAHLRKKWIHFDIAHNERGALALGTGTRLLMHVIPWLAKRT